MQSNTGIVDRQRKTLLSMAWIFVLLNMVYADILGMLRPGYLEFLEHISQQLTSSAVLLFAVLMEIPISMVLLSQILAYKANRWVHFIAVPLTILWVVIPALMPSLGNSTPPSYVFFASVEVVTMLIILRFVWKWPQPQKRREI